MGFTINTEEDERLWHAYREHRDALRNVMGYGVYPNLVKAIETLAAFDAALDGPLADLDLLVYHQSLMAPIAPYMTQIQQLAAGLVAIMQAIETAQPGTFGITVPAEAPDMPLKINTTGSVGLTPPGDPQTMLHIETENSE